MKKGRTRNKSSILYSEQNIKIFLNLVEQYGAGKWTAIADALQLHGIMITYPQGLSKTYENLTLKIEKNFSPNIGLGLLDLMLEYRLKVKPIIEQWAKESGKTYLPQEVYGKYKKFFFVSTKCFVSMFVRYKLKYIQFFINHYAVRNTKHILKIIKATFQDEHSIQVQESCKKFIEFLRSYTQDIQFPREQNYQKYSLIFNRRSATKMINDIIYVICITQILQGYQFPYSNLTNMCSQIHPTDMSANEESPIYKLLYKLRNAPKMYQQYFEASQNCLYRSEFTHVIGEEKKFQPVTELQPKIITKLGKQAKAKAQNEHKTFRSAYKEKTFASSLYVQAIKDEEAIEIKEKKKLLQDFDSYSNASIDSEFIENEFRLMQDPKLMEHIRKRNKIH